MKDLKRTKFNLFFVLIVLTLLQISCSKDQSEFDSQTNTKTSFNMETDVDMNEATTIGLNFANSSNIYSRASQKDLKSTNSATRTIKNYITHKDSVGNPTLYIISYEPEGFLIISGTKKEQPVLGFSYTGFFEENENNLGFKDWLTITENGITKMRNDTNITASNEVSMLWDSFLLTEAEETPTTQSEFIEVGPLCNTKWGQGYGFNNDCPDDNCTSTSNGRDYAGCVAIAQAQVMKYWEYPTTYNFSEMDDIYGGTEASKMIYDVGLAVDMSYGCGGSGAVTSKIVNSLTNTFGYTSSPSYISYDENELINQLDKKYPVVMRGYDANYSVGHAFVCDGYHRYKVTTTHNSGANNEYETYEYENEYTHMNWGWNGSSNGWFAFGTFNPSYNFKNISMIINIHP